MAGVKGKSGRPSKYRELRIFELADKATNWALENWDNLTKEERIKIFISIAPKYVTEKKEITGSEGSPLTIRWASNA